MTPDATPQTAAEARAEYEALLERTSRWDKDTQALVKKADDDKKAMLVTRRRQCRELLDRKAAVFTRWQQLAAAEREAAELALASAAEPEPAVLPAPPVELPSEPQPDGPVDAGRTPVARKPKR